MEVEESCDIVPVIIRRKIIYPQGFRSDGISYCPFEFPGMKRKGIHYQQKKTEYVGERVCRRYSQTYLSFYPELKSGKALANYHNIIPDGYRLFGPASPNAIIYQKIKPYCIVIERNYG